MKNPDPVFVYAPLRAGTTLLRLMIECHPDLKNPGEADYLFDYIVQRKDGRATYDVDGLRLERIFRNARITVPASSNAVDVVLPSLLRQLDAKGPGRLTLNVHRNADKIVEYLPNARFIRLLRDPRDVAYSSIGMNWAGSVYKGVDPWIVCERAWNDVRDRIPPENVHTLKYEDLVRQPETVLTALCGFMGVPFDDAMFDFPQRSTYSAPDPRHAYKWKRRPNRAELALIEGKVGALLQDRGYQPSGVVPRAPTVAERARMALQDRARRYRADIARYGLVLVASEKMARWVGMKAAQRMLQARINRIANSYTK